jgi:hypothetical protein
MVTVPPDVLHAIGSTSMVRLRKVVPPGCATILAKLEWENPTGSLKDRMAHAVISRAEQDGRLKPGGTVIEYTGGSTGTSLALVCAVIPLFADESDFGKIRIPRVSTPPRIEEFLSMEPSPAWIQGFLTG